MVPVEYMKTTHGVLTFAKFRQLILLKLLMRGLERLIWIQLQ